MLSPRAGPAATLEEPDEWAPETWWQPPRREIVSAEPVPESWWQSLRKIPGWHLSSRGVGEGSAPSSCETTPTSSFSNLGDPLRAERRSWRAAAAGVLRLVGTLAVLALCVYGLTQGVFLLVHNTLKYRAHVAVWVAWGFAIWVFVCACGVRAAGGKRGAPCREMVRRRWEEWRRKARRRCDGCVDWLLDRWELLRWRRHRTPAVLRGWATNADWSVASSVSNSLDDPLLDHAPADTPPRVRRELELPATG